MKTLVEPVTLIRERRRQKQKHKRRKSSANDVLMSLVMASHVRGLECWHALIRTGNLPFEVDCVLHVDSHPDMMLPKGDFTEIERDPRAMYERLEASQGGIAEWLLPAFYLGHCKRLIWLRAVWCDQLKDGESEFYIGRHRKDGSLKVTSLEPYFADEAQMYSPLEELENPCKISLLVTSLDQVDAGQTIRDFLLQHDTPNPTWLLDICLDYFAVSNPFLDHAIRLFGHDLAQKLRNAFLTVRWRQVYERQRCETGGGLRGEKEAKEKEEFEMLVRTLLSQATSQNHQEIASGLQLLYDDQQPVNDLLSIAASIRERGSEGVLVAMELMESPGLPHHPELDFDQQHRFRQLLHEDLKLYPPTASIIAKSDEDEYTPNSVCQHLDQWVAETLETAWGDGKRIETVSVEVYEED